MRRHVIILSSALHRFCRLPTLFDVDDAHSPGQTLNADLVRVLAKSPVNSVIRAKFGGVQHEFMVIKNAEDGYVLQLF